MLPCARRRRRASGDMSTSSTWSARRTTSSGIVVAPVLPVSSSTTSCRLASCSTSRVDTTSIPASRSTCTSCQRHGRSAPVGLAVARSSTRHTSGPRASTAVDVQHLVTVEHQRRDRSRPASIRSASGRAPRCRRRRSRRGCPAGRGAGPRRAWRTSCRLRRRPRGRCATCREPWAQHPPPVGCRREHRGRSRGRCPAVLVVDDEPQLRKALATNLTVRGYEVDLAATGEEALDLAARRHPDLVLLDLGLPGIGGIEVVAGAPRLDRRADHRAVGHAATEADKVAGPRRGRRRLPHQAVRHARAPRPRARRPAAGRARVRGGAGGRRPTASPSTWPPRWRAGATAPRCSLTPTEWGVVEVLVRNRGRLVTPRQLLQEVWGPQYERRDQLPAGLPRPDPPEARAGPGPAAPLHHRARHGLPVRPVTS